jgi:putrescine aminotransferase
VKFGLSLRNNKCADAKKTVFRQLEDNMTKKENVIKDLEKVIKFIHSDELTDAEKKEITEETVSYFDTYVSPGWLKYRKSVSTNAAVVEWKDYGAYCTGLYGEEFIDCLGGFGIYTCGHRNPEIIDTVKAQLEHQALHSQELLDPLRGYLAKAVADITPGDLEKCFFTNGGAEAVEMALKLARIATGGKWFISTVGAFHGKSMGAVSMGGKGTYRVPYAPMVQQVQHVEYGNATDLRKAIKNLHTVGESVAAVILEPIQGEAGIIVPPAGYLKEVREICDEYHVALIFDEIQTGMGRTGTMFRCEAEGVTPDILTFGKAFGGGILPITGIICRPHMWTEQLIENPWLLGSPTFGGNPLACSAAIATIKYMLEHDIPKQCAEKGEYLLKGLKDLAKKFPTVISDVRGIGLMIGLEFVTSDIGYSVAKGMFARRVMTAGTLVNSKCIRFEPAAVITYDDIDQVLARLEEALDDTKLEFNLGNCETL